MLDVVLQTALTEISTSVHLKTSPREFAVTQLVALVDKEKDFAHLTLK